MATNIAPMPEMLHRKDVEGGEWTIETCDAVRGAPHTNIVDKKMAVPHDDDEMARTIRAHEMMHAKVSPANDFDKWIERDIASVTAMRAVEEVRVNYLIGKVGFDLLTVNAVQRRKIGLVLFTWQLPLLALHPTKHS